MEPQNVSCYFFSESHSTFLPLAGDIIGQSEAFYFTGYLVIPPQPVLYPLYTLGVSSLAALKLKITLLDYLVTSIKDHDPAYEPGQQGKEVPIYIDCCVLGVTLDWDIAWYKQGPDKVHRVYQWPQDNTDNGDLFCPVKNSLAPSEIEVGVTQEIADGILKMVEPLTSPRKQPSVVPGVYLLAPWSPVDSSPNLYSPMDSVPELWIVSSAMDASSIQMDDDARQPNEPETSTDTLHKVLAGVPRWRNTLICLRLKMKVVICCGDAQNPFLLLQLIYSEQKMAFFNELFKQSLIAVDIALEDLEQVVSKDGVTTIRTDEMSTWATKWLAGFIFELKCMAKLALMDTRSSFSFGLHDTSASDPSLLANNQSFELPWANGMWLLRHEIIKSLIFYAVFCFSVTCGSRVVLADREPAIFRTATLPPMEMWYSAFLTRLSELVKAMRTSGLPVNITIQTDNPAYPDLLQVLASLCNIKRPTTAGTIVPDPLFATTSMPFGWVDPLDLTAVLQVGLRVAAIERRLLKEHNTIITFLVRGGKAIANLCEELQTKCHLHKSSTWSKAQRVQEADKHLVTSQVTQLNDVDLLLINCDQLELSSATREKCEAWLATSWQFEVDFPQAHEVPELYEHSSKHDNDFLSPLMEAWFGSVTHRTYITTSSADSNTLCINAIESFKAKKNKTPDALKSDFSILEMKKHCAQAEVDMFSEVIARTARIQCTDDGLLTVVASVVLH
ncbi:hypothetical protein EV702DRAFT_1050867 [Suillus placidus]|uniref:Ig-like domain-containing protein n=1 Tax=Suillus placidus TaxID=48579 RepID=A0A9P6ZH01_9AGAM|nr:hypothetical protein EV702DRAFT_1050867 [Suillus placidus]